LKATVSKTVMGHWPIESSNLSLSAQRYEGQHLGRPRSPWRGWGNYFRWGNSTRKFTQIDSYVHERLALFDSKKRNQRGRRWAEVHTYAWFKGLGVHLLAGSIRWRQAATAAT
jgi:hypothetical protein